jgi:hypothetical protein
VELAGPPDRRGGLLPNRTGCAWRYLPADFPPWQTVYGYFAARRDVGTLARLPTLWSPLTGEPFIHVPAIIPPPDHLVQVSGVVAAR